MTGYIECRLAGAYKRTALRSVSFRDRKSTRLNSSHLVISYAVFCLKKKIPPAHPRTAHGSSGVVEGAGALTASSCVPAKLLLVDDRRCVDVRGGISQYAALTLRCVQ